MHFGHGRLGGILGITWAMTLRITLAGCFACGCLLASAAETAVISINGAKPGPEINPRMYGVFLEEINHGVDGGLYGELVRNRAFEDALIPGAAWRHLS